MPLKSILPVTARLASCQHVRVSSVLDHLPQLGDRCCLALWMLGYGRAGHELTRSGIVGRSDGLGADAPIHLDADRQPPLSDHGRRLPDLGQHGVDERLSAKPGVDRHDEQRVDVLQHMLRSLDWGGGVQGHSRLQAGPPNLLDDPVQVHACFGVTISRSFPARAKSSTYRPGSSIIKWASKGTLVWGRQSAMTSQPTVRFGTYMPSITSHCRTSAPARSRSASSSASLDWSTLRVEGTIW